MDSKWVEAHQSFIKSLSKDELRSSVSVAQYPVNKFVGYNVGNARQIQYGIGNLKFMYKVYFELIDFAHDLTPERYLEFSNALDRDGFSGDSKIQLSPGFMRFHFNNIVVHARSLNDALIAERVGLDFFKGNLAARARGLDVEVNKKMVLDWSEFLCQQDISQLPADALNYVTASE